MTEPHLVSILDIAENALTVGNIASFPLICIDPMCKGAEAEDRMRRVGFDVLPIADDDSIYRFIELVALESERSVGQIGRPIEARHVLPSGVSLAEGLEALHRHPFYFVLVGRRIGGIVTRADVQRSPVGMLVFSLVLAVEAGLNILIDDTFAQDSWLELLSGRRAQRVQEVMNERSVRNSEIGLIDCLMLEDRLRLACRPEIRARLGHSKKSFKRWEEELKGVRNVLAHGGSILDFESDPMNALELIRRIREFAETVWACEHVETTELTGASEGK